MNPINGQYRVYENLGKRFVPVKKGKGGPTTPKWHEKGVSYSDAVEVLVMDEQYDKVAMILDPSIIVIDIDQHDGGANGFESLAQLEKDLGGKLLDDMTNAIVHTPSGGTHYYFRKPEDVHVSKGLDKYPAIDFLSPYEHGKASCVIAAGSKHKSKQGTYYFEGDISPDDIPEMPRELMDHLVKETEAKRSASKAAQSVQTIGSVTFTSQDRGGVKAGDDYNRSQNGLQHLAGTLVQHGYEVRQVGDGKYTYRHPNATHDFSGTLGNRSDAGNYQLYNFSTSIDLPVEQSITIFHAYSILCHGGDKTAAASALYGQGFGSQPDTSDFDLDIFKDNVSSSEKVAKRKPLSLESKPIERQRRPYLIKGLLREGEVMNVIAAPKMGKSWMVYNLAYSCAAGRQFLGHGGDRKLKTLILDAELHPEELLDRTEKVATELRVGPVERTSVCFDVMRGEGYNIHHLAEQMEALDAADYDLVVIDALYRFLPEGTSENDNAQMMALYNKLDALAAQFDVGIIVVHHASKGNQGDKSITDVGAGAGAISRAADTHVIIREQLKDESQQDLSLFVVDAVVRSGISPKPMVCEFQWPLWDVREDISPMVASFENSRAMAAKKQADEAEAAVEAAAVFIASKGEAGATSAEIAARVSKGNGWVSKNANKIEEHGVWREQSGANNAYIYYGAEVEKSMLTSDDEDPRIKQLVDFITAKRLEGVPYVCTNDIEHGLDFSRGKARHAVELALKAGRIRVSKKGSYNVYSVVAG